MNATATRIDWDAAARYTVRTLRDQHGNSPLGRALDRLLDQSQLTRQAAILASAYNVCGPRTGAYATPTTVRSLADSATLARCVDAYAKHVAADPDALYTVAEVNEAVKAVRS
ncbi:MAG TPA: hypothetical protein VM619_14680 [Luteimonas sp.]|nr:hypothetical protein [Luteimonas sp.]